MEKPMAQTLDRPAAYTIDGFAERLTISRGTVYNLIKSGQLRVVKIGTRTVIPAEEVNRILGETGPEAA